MELKGDYLQWTGKEQVKEAVMLFQCIRTTKGNHEKLIQDKECSGQTLELYSFWIQGSHIIDTSTYKMLFPRPLNIFLIGQRLVACSAVNEVFIKLSNNTDGKSF